MAPLWLQSVRAQSNSEHFRFTQKKFKKIKEVAAPIPSSICDWPLPQILLTVSARLSTFALHNMPLSTFSGWYTQLPFLLMPKNLHSSSIQSLTLNSPLDDDDEDNNIIGNAWNL